MLKNYFKVYRNGVFVGETKSASLKEAKESIRQGILIGGAVPGTIRIGTHMGEWQRVVNGYRYFTTVGVTIEFVRFAKEVARANA